MRPEMLNAKEPCCSICPAEEERKVVKKSLGGGEFFTGGGEFFTGGSEFYTTLIERSRLEEGSLEGASKGTTG